VKICVVGAGAVGGVIAAWLARAGHEVSLVARGTHLEAVRASGLTLEENGKQTNFRLPASSEPGDFGAQDAVFLCLKTYSIAAMLPRLSPLLGPETVVVPTINGLPWWYFYKEGGRFDGRPIESLDPGGAMLAALDPQRIVGCVVHASMMLAAPGIVRHIAGSRFLLGEPDRSRSARSRSVVEAMSSAGIEAELASDIRVEIWTKLVGNLSYNPVAALTLAYMDDIHASEPILDLIRTLMEETMRVAEAYGVRVPMTIEERIGIARKLPGARISMQQDVVRRRPLETDAIVGAVVELARKAGIATPMIDAVHALLAERARHLDR